MSLRIANKLKHKFNKSKIELIAEILEEDDVMNVAPFLAQIPNVKTNWRAWGRPQQFMPDTMHDWLIWAILADRGFGKTRSASEAIREWVNGTTKTTDVHLKNRLALIGATYADTDYMVTGNSGILNVCQDDANRVKYIKTKRQLVWESGATAYLYSAEEPTRLRGAQFDGAWCEEITSWRYPEAFEILQFGLRLGQHPQIITTIDYRKAEGNKLVEDILAHRRTLTTVGATLENSSNLPKRFIDLITEKYNLAVKGETANA